MGRSWPWGCCCRPCWAPPWLMITLGSGRACPPGSFTTGCTPGMSAAWVFPALMWQPRPHACLLQWSAAHGWRSGAWVADGQAACGRAHGVDIAGPCGRPAHQAASPSQHQVPPLQVHPLDDGGQGRVVGRALGLRGSVFHPGSACSGLCDLGQVTLLFEHLLPYQKARKANLHLGDSELAEV